MTIAGVDLDIVEQVASRINGHSRKPYYLPQAEPLLRPAGPSDDIPNREIIVYLNRNDAGPNRGPDFDVTQIVRSRIAVRHRLSSAKGQGNRRAGRAARTQAEKWYSATRYLLLTGGWRPDGARTFVYGGAAQLVTEDGSYWVVEDYYDTEWVLAASALTLPPDSN